MNKNIIYKITFPNSKIYVGIDWGRNGHSFRYFGSWNAEAVRRDFTPEQQRDFTIRREVLYESEDAALVRKLENEYILSHGANNPTIGYNKIPKYKDPI